MIAEEFEDLVLCYSTNYKIELEDIERDLFEGYYESCTNSDNEIDTGFMDEIEKESIGEMFASFNPVIIRQWTHGTMKITEEVYA